MVINLKNIEAIILDLGGVILNLDYDLTVKKFDFLNVPNFKKLFSKAEQNSFFDLFETGKVSSQGFRDEIKKLNPNLTTTLIDNAWNAMLLDLPKERIMLIERLKKDFNVFLLSNTNAIHVESFLKIANQVSPNGNFRNLFDGCYFSNEIGLRKPNESIFNFVLDQHKLSANKTLFIDDSSQHIEGAKKVGLSTHHLLVDKENLVSLFGNY